MKLKYLFDGFHNGKVTCLDPCLHRPFLVSCSNYDSTIRIWNYSSKKCELARKFYVGEDNQGNIHPLQFVAFHPTGFYMAVSFINKLRFYHVLQVKLRLYREVDLKKCTYMSFSVGGQFLAAAHPATSVSNQTQQAKY